MLYARNCLGFPQSFTVNTHGTLGTGYLHFTGEKTEAEENIVVCLRSHRVAKPEFE